MVILLSYGEDLILFFYRSSDSSSLLQPFIHSLMAFQCRVVLQISCFMDFDQDSKHSFPECIQLCANPNHEASEFLCLAWIESCL